MHMLLASLLVVSAGRISLQTTEPVYMVHFIVDNCDANVQPHPSSPWQSVILPCDDGIKVLAAGPTLAPGTYDLFTTNLCPLIPAGTVCDGTTIEVEYQCEPVAVAGKTWSGVKGLYR